MKKEEIIKRYGEEAWGKYLERQRAYYKAHREEQKARAKKYHEEHPEQEKARNKKYREEHLEEAKVNDQEASRKGGKYYEKQLEYQHTGLQGARNRIRKKHGNQYRPYKAIIAPDSQLHHEWVPDTSEYRGVALVEKEQHMHGFVDVIEILDGTIALLTEEEVKAGGRKSEN